MALFFIFFLASISTSVSLQATLRKTGSTIHFDLPLTHTHSISLTLTRSHGAQPEVKASSRSKDVKKEGRYQTTSYEDPSHNAIFSVETSTDPSQPNTLYYGSFSYSGSFFDLEPSSAIDAQPSSMHKKVYDLEIEGQAYKLYEENPLLGGSQDDDLESDFENEKASEVTRFSSQMQAAIKQPRGRVIVEFLIVLDASVLKKWMGITKNKEKAIHNIKYYYTHIANGVRANYDLIKDPAYKVMMHFSGIYIAETESDDPYSRDLYIRSGKHLDADKALYKWVEFLNLKKGDARFPAFDVAAAFTDYSTQGLNGLAFVEAACRSNSVSVNKDNGPYQSINTITHEIGHNLGSRHDGETNSCSKEDQYIMAGSRAKMTDVNFKNQFVFSPCSIKYFKEYLVMLKRENLDCLRNVPTSMPAHSNEDFLSQYPGQKYNIDEQCTIVRGSGSTTCGGVKSDKNFCMGMRCMNPTLNVCSSNINLAPAEGTTCGHKKWCLAGKCVVNSRAPAFRDSCLTGDSKELIPTLEGNENCRDLIAKKPYFCYDEYYNNQCCLSCYNLRQTGTEICPYGDKYSDCKEDHCSYNTEVCCRTCANRTNKKPTKNTKTEYKADKTSVNACIDQKDCRLYQPYHCYDATLANDCCETCEKHKVPGSNKECMFGDVRPWCKNRVKLHPDECHRSEDIKKRCCLSCRGIVDKTKGCHDIDHCADIKPNNCYDDDVENNCCATCKKHRKNRSGDCRYGNRYRYCKKNLCKEKSFSSLCCEIC